MNTSANLDGTEEIEPLAKDNSGDPGSGTIAVDEKGTSRDVKEVPLSEEFQARVLDLVKDASKDELSFIRDQCFKCEQDMNKPEVSTDDYEAVKADE